MHAFMHSSTIHVVLDRPQAHGDIDLLFDEAAMVT